MPRPIRIEYENAFYHVMNRGRDRQNIFHNSLCYELFLQTLNESHKRFDAVIHAYCLMKNHYHLLIETPRGNLGRIMRHVNGVYTQRYNRLRNTDGPLFRGRYKAILVDEDAYLLQLSRYIHRNPVETKGSRAKLSDFEWSSYPAYIGKVPAPPWLYCEQIYQLLGQKQRFKGYRNFVDDGVDEEIKQYYGKGNIAAILGNNTFRESVCEKNEALDSGVLQNAIKYRPSLKAIVKAVAHVFDVPESKILRSVGRGEGRNDVRKLAMYCCQHIGDIALSEIAEGFDLGHVGSVSRLIYDAKMSLQQSEIRRKLKKIESLLKVIQ